MIKVFLFFEMECKNLSKSFMQLFKNIKSKRKSLENIESKSTRVAKYRNLRH